MRRAAAVTYEPAPLAVDPRHWGSPGSMQLSGLKKEDFRRAGGMPPAVHVHSIPARPMFLRTKAFPLGGRWPGASRVG